MDKMMKKLSWKHALILAFACIALLAWLPTYTVQAQGTVPQNVWVGDQQIWQDGAGTGATVEGVTYDGATGKLTLGGGVTSLTTTILSGTTTTTLVSSGKEVTACIIADGDLTVSLNNDGVLNGGDGIFDFDVAEGIYVDGSLWIESVKPESAAQFSVARINPGNQTATVAGKAYHIYVEEDIHIGQKVRAEVITDNDEVGLRANRLVTNQGSLRVIGSTNMNYYCLDVSSIVVNGGELSFYIGNPIGNHLFVDSDVTIESGLDYWNLEAFVTLKGETESVKTTDFDWIRSNLANIKYLGIRSPISWAGDIPRVTLSELEDGETNLPSVGFDAKIEVGFQSSIDSSKESIKWTGDISSLFMNEEYPKSELKIYVGDFYRGDGSNLKVLHNYTALVGDFSMPEIAYEETRTYKLGDNVVKEYDYAASGAQATTVLKDITVTMSYDASTGWITLSGVEGLSPFAVVVQNPTVTATAGEGGAIAPAGATSVAPGESLTFTMTPESGYQVSKVLLDGAEVAVTDNTYTLSDIQVDHTVHVEFIAEEAPAIAEPPAIEEAPATGDTTNAFPWIMAFLCGIAITTFWVKREMNS